jgi:hypothetical protein
MREKHRPELFENKVLRKISGDKKQELAEVGENSIMKRCMQWRTQEFCSGGEGCSTNSVEDRGQREQGSGGGSPLVRGSGGSCNLV